MPALRISRSPSSNILLILASLSCLFTPIVAHGGHADKIPEGAGISDDPLDSRLWTHILLMTVAFGLIFPFGMVLGMVRSRWHVPVQIVGTCVAVVAYFLGHMHKGRQFAHPNIHAYFANWLMLMMVVQVGIGAGLKLHLEEKKGWIGRVFGGKGGLYGRRLVVIVHGVLGKAMPVVSWTQMLFGGIVSMGYCRGDHLGQCLAHFIMGSGFIAYGVIMTILLLVGQAWLRRTGKSQEFFDSIVIAVWGCVNTFTEHRWGHPWVKNDLQHTSMGIVWWCAGLLGVWLSRSRGGRPRRNILPGIVILITGWAMSSHPQDLPLSTMVHAVFGYTLMAAGATRIIEISFLLRDSRGGGEPNSWQHLPPFLLYASGFLFMGATEEQMDLLSDAHVTHVSYILILYSVSFLLYLFVNILLHIYATHTWPDDESNGQIALARKMSMAVNGNGMNGSHSRLASYAGPSGGNFRKYSQAVSPNPNMLYPGSPNLMQEENGMSENMNGNARRPVHPPRIPRRSHNVTDSQQVRDAEEFELEGLISDVDEDPQSPDIDGTKEKTRS